jgi:hypothetical protein
MSDSPPDDPTPADAPPAVAPWVSTQHEMESDARPQRTRLFRMRTRIGLVRVAAVTYFQATARNTSDTRVEHLYRVQLAWLSEFDPRDGTSQRYAERTSTARPTNALQFRVLEMAGPDGRRLAAAKIGPKGQIAADPPGMGVMGLLRALLVEWVMALHPDASVLTGSLNQADAPSEAQAAQRDAFFARAGFTVKPTSGGGGKFYADTVRDLKSTWNPDKATELTTPLLVDAVNAQLETPQLRQQVAALQDQLTAARKTQRATETLQRIWLAVTVLAVLFALVLAIQPRLG